MTLGIRQSRLYTDTVDVYRRETLTVHLDTHVDDPTYPATPALTGVKCHFQSRPENDSPQVMGRMEQDIIFTMHEFHFHDSVQIRDTDILRLKTQGHSMEGSFFYVLGDPEPKHWRAKKMSVLCKNGPPISVTEPLRGAAAIMLTPSGTLSG